MKEQHLWFSPTYTSKCKDIAVIGVSMFNRVCHLVTIADTTVPVPSNPYNSLEDCVHKLHPQITQSSHKLQYLTKLMG